MLSLSPSPFCSCPVCKDKKFFYPNDLPHKSAPFEYIFFSFQVKDREKIDLRRLEKFWKIKKLKKEAEEISILLYNIYHENQDIQRVEEFMEKSGINKFLNNLKWLKALKKRQSYQGAID